MAVPQAQLTEAFRAFNQLASELSQSYTTLQQRVVALQDELTTTRSDRLRQLAAKERLAERLSKLLEALPGGVVVLDAAAVVRETNRLAEDWLGQPLQGEPWHRVAARAFKMGASGNLFLADGRPLNLSTRDLEGDTGSIILITDETEARRLEEAASRNDRLAAMGEMASRLAHQIRTPLASALLYTSRIGAGKVDTADQGALSEKSMACLRRLERMVNDMLVFARGGSGDTSEIVFAQTLFADLRNALTPQLDTAAVRLVVTDASQGVGMRGHREALLSVLLNLVDNAMQACGPGGEVEVSARLDRRRRLVLSVGDDGPGIDENVRARMFEPFFTTRTQGTGLGLAVVRAVVSGYGGEIHVETSKGAGTRVDLTLPTTSSLAEALPSGGEGRLALRDHRGGDRTAPDTNPVEVTA